MAPPESGVRHLGVELDGVEAARRDPRSRRCGRWRSAPATVKPGGACGDVVAVAHPHRLAVGEAGEDRAPGGRPRPRRGRTRGARRRLDAAAERVRHRPACRSRCRAPACRGRRGPRSASAASRVVDALRSAGEDDADRLPAADLLDRQSKGWTSQYTRCSRTRRAMICVNWLPKSRIRTVWCVAMGGEDTSSRGLGGAPPAPS